jgi:hypothetical protein
MTDVTSPAAAAQATTNGGAADPQLDAKLVKLLRAEVAQRRNRVDELVTELDELKPALKRYERVLAQLTGEPMSGPAPGPRKKNKRGGSATDRGKGIGAERLEGIRRAVLHYARDHDEFAQVDIRAFAGDEVTGGGTGIMTLAFEQLRQENTIRFARQDGNKKMFRLTREAAREVESE